MMSSLASRGDTKETDFEDFFLEDKTELRCEKGRKFHIAVIDERSQLFLLCILSHFRENSQMASSEIF